MNQLIKETSPYLLQHAHNPVDWYPWGEEAFQKAKEENKPVLVSIGYSSCHWCHVMERESFENDSIAQLMNDNLICIKVDREERPDIDQVYMDAVHAMGLRGGWPLNVFVLPDRKPFYGGTYFPPQQWGNLVKQVNRAFNENKEDLTKSAAEFEAYLNSSELAKFGIQEEGENALSKEVINLSFERLKDKYDALDGGIKKAPKFPMPTVWEAALRYYAHSNDEETKHHTLKTLDKIALGGIYDQLGGGFARYSVDGQWFAPHFEKMLYDNGQLLSLYAHAYQIDAKPLYAHVIDQTVAFLEREMQSEDGGFYSALDADSEGEEGKYYTWTWEELKQVLGAAPSEAWMAYYGVEKEGNWEHGKNILHVTIGMDTLAKAKNIEPSALQKDLEQTNTKLLAARESRVRPGLDDKQLASWNALTITGLCDAYDALGEKKYKALALRVGQFLEDHLVVNGQLMHTYKEGKATIPAFLEDYATAIFAFSRLYEISFEEKWLHLANELLQSSKQQFYNQEEGFFYFTSSEQQELPARKMDLLDNVIPASNSIMAHNLVRVGTMMFQREDIAIGKRMVSKMMSLVEKDIEYTANWASIALYLTNEPAEVIVMGDKALEKRDALAKRFNPFMVLMGSETESDLELLQNRLPDAGETLIYVCHEGQCQLPTPEVEKALAQL